MRESILLLLACLAASCQGAVSSSSSVNLTAAATSVFHLTNSLGPTILVSEWGSTEVRAEITYFAQDASSLAALVAQQPASILGNTLTLVGRTSLSPEELGGSCRIPTYSQSTPRIGTPPCKPLTITFPPGNTETPQPSGARVRLFVPPTTRVCVNTYCASPMFNVVPPLSPELVDLGDGVVYDLQVGVMWQQEIIPERFDYQWTPGNANWPIINRVEAACNASRVGGFSDWRIPGRSELHRMGDFLAPVGEPALNATMFPYNDTDYYRGLGYWTNIRSKVNDYEAVYFIQEASGGLTWSFDVRSPNGERVRCVRSVINREVSPTQPRWFRSASQQAATDTHSGLEWQINFPTTTYPTNPGASAAIAYCDALDYDGRRDWRLPNTKELVSMMSEHRVAPAVDVDALGNSPKVGWLWASNPNHFYGGTFEWGYNLGDGLNYVNVNPGMARCVRDSDDLIAAPTATPPTTTTASPTTLAPTTPSPTSLAPTSAAPTTVSPTQNSAPGGTFAPTTAAPTTASPTTLAPTTLASTTLAPTTLAPTFAPPPTFPPSASSASARALGLLAVFVGILAL